MSRTPYRLPGWWRAPSPVPRAVMITTLLCVALSGAALGAGFSIYEQGAKALGMGGAFAAVADDPSAMFFNPAGLALVEGRQLYAGPSLIMVPGKKFSGVNPYPGYGVEETTTTDLFYPVNAYYAHQLNEQWVVGAALFSPFGLKVEWEEPETFSGRYYSTLSNLVPFFFGGTAAWKVNDKLALGGGVMMVHSKVELEQHLARNVVGLDDISPIIDVGTVALEASNGVDFGFSFGALLSPTDKLSVGFGYRSEVEVTYDGDADFTQLMTGNPQVDGVIGALFPQDQDASLTFSFPMQWSLGLALEPNEDWTLAFDLSQTGWSSFDRLVVGFEDPDLELDEPQNWEDVFSYRFGAEWRCRPDWALRAGGYLDDNPQPDETVSPLLPDADRTGLSLGFGHTFGKYTLDVYDLAVIFDERSTNGVQMNDFNGTYKSFVNIIGLNLGIQF